MSEARKRCPKGENYNKETKRCEPKGESAQRVSTRKAKPIGLELNELPEPKGLSKASKSRAKTAKSVSPKGLSSPKGSSSPKGLSKSSSSPKGLSKSSPKGSSKSVDSFIMHEGGNSYRLLVSVPVNNPSLWPNANICLFRTSGRSNKGYEIFRGSWFPIAGIKDSSKMPKFLSEKNDGFLIKMGFIMNKNEDYSDAHKQPSWITNLIGDYPIILDESEKSLFDNKSVITIDEFFAKNKFIENKKNKTIDTRYERLALHIKLIIDNSFGNFLNYFLYEWQAMLSLRIGGGYWDSNPVFTEYISTKLATFDLVPVPHIDERLKRVSEAELGKIYDSDPSNNKESNRGKPTIAFSERVGTQLSLDQITAIKNVEEAKLKSEKPGSKLPFQLFTLMQEKYTNKMNGYIRLVENARNTAAHLFKFKI